jgi:hypothetical protein
MIHAAIAHTVIRQELDMGMPFQVVLFRELVRTPPARFAAARVASFKIVRAD